MQKMQESDREVLSRKVPFIMMSARDDADTVMKCLQGGAADYLVKPIRKNELKNLWTHVWRNTRHTSVVDERPQRSGSESLTPKTPENSGAERASLDNGLPDKAGKAEKVQTEEEVVVTLQRARAPDEPADKEGTMTVKLQLHLHPMIPNGNRVKLSAQEGGNSAFKAFSRSYMAFKPPQPYPSIGNGGHSLGNSMMPPMIPPMPQPLSQSQQRNHHPSQSHIPTAHDYIHSMHTFRNGNGQSNGDGKCGPNGFGCGDSMNKENGEQRIPMHFRDTQQRSVTTLMDNSGDWISHGDDGRTSGSMEKYNVNSRKRQRNEYYEGGDGEDTPTWNQKKIIGDWEGRVHKGSTALDGVHGKGNGNDTLENTERHEEAKATTPTEGSRSEHSEERRAEAVRKYKEKRMNRCFEKKVRYQSRKRVAESRPRVLGRFVKAA